MKINFIKNLIFNIYLIYLSLKNILIYNIYYKY